MITDRSLSLVLDGIKFLLGSLVGAIVVKRVEGKPKLMSHWGHSSAFTVRPPEGEPFVIHTHEVVVQNAGKKSATNVRLSHYFLPDQFNISPSIPYSLETLPDGRRDIVIPALVPNQRITVAYLYYPPLTFTGVNAGIRYDDGFATPMEMELSAKNSVAFNLFAFSMFVIGCLTTLYFIWLGMSKLGL